MSEAAAKPHRSAAAKMSHPALFAVAAGMGASPTAVRSEWAWVDVLDAMHHLEAKAQSMAIQREEADRG